MKVKNLLSALKHLKNTGELEDILEHEINFSVGGHLLPVSQLWLIEQEKLMILKADEQALWPANKSKSVH